MTLLLSVRLHKTKAVIYSEFANWILRVNEKDKEALERKDQSTCFKKQNQGE